MDRKDVAYCIVGEEQHLYVLDIHTTLLTRYAPGCKWNIQKDLNVDSRVRYCVIARIEHLLLGRPNEKEIQLAFHLLDDCPSIKSICLTPQAIEGRGWVLSEQQGEGVLIHRASEVSAITNLHLVWAKEGSHANACLLGPWPTRPDVLQAESGCLQEWALEFAEREGILLRGPSLR